MKKFVTLMLVALVAVSALFALTACDAPKDPKNQYVCTGQWNGWDKTTITDDGPLESALMTAIKADDARVAPIKDDLKDAKYIYIFEQEFTNNKKDDGTWEAGWSIRYKLTEDAEDYTEVDGNMTVKVIRTRYEEVEVGEEKVSSWVKEWIPSPENHNIKTLTPDTFYLPNMASASEAWEGSGDWSGNPMVLKAGTFYVVYVEYNDGSMGMGLIEKK